MANESLIKTPAQLLGERRRPKQEEVRATMNAVGEEVYNAIAKQHAAAFNALHTEMEKDLVIIHQDILEQCEAMIEARTLRGRIWRAWAWFTARMELVVEEVWHREYFTAEGEKRRAGDPTDELCDGTSNCSRADEHDVDDAAPEGTATPELVRP